MQGAYFYLLWANPYIAEVAGVMMEFLDMVGVGIVAKPPPNGNIVFRKNFDDGGCPAFLHQQR